MNKNRFLAFHGLSRVWLWNQLDKASLMILLCLDPHHRYKFLSEIFYETYLICKTISIAQHKTYCAANELKWTQAYRLIAGKIVSDISLGFTTFLSLFQQKRIMALEKIYLES